MVEPPDPRLNSNTYATHNPVSPPESAIGQALYTGEVELVLPSPVDLKLASKLYNSLQTIPELKVLLTRGTVSRGVVIKIVIDKPHPLIGTLLSRLADVQAIPEKSVIDFPELNNTSLPGTEQREPKKRIRLVTREA